MKLGIVGIGIVGRALLKYFLKQKHEIAIYDTKGIGTLEGAVKADYIYICVPTPSREDGSCDTSIVEDTIRRINDIKEGIKTIIIKSTIIVGTTERLQAQYPELLLMYNPEFLTEATAVENMLYPDRQIVGYTKQSFCKAYEVMKQLPDAPFKRFMQATEAEMVKYFGNSFYAVKVVFANQIYDLCKKLDIDYERVKESVIVDKMIGENHWDIWHGGYRGYNGKCLPKDTKALIALGNELGVRMDVLKAVDMINESLLKLGNKDAIN